MYKKIFKPIFDRILAIAGFIILFPIFLVVLIILTFTNHGHPFFFQIRPGKNGKLFKIIKFKTMHEKKSKAGQLLPDDMRLTKIGLLVRKASIDEIPQLLNVIKGDMSLIGPRPLLTEYLSLYNADQSRRHEVKPGITGWAQVNGRNTLGWEEKFEYDVWYVDHLNLALDLKIIWLTIKGVLRSEGISSANSKTMEKFKGN
jgi:lipopolysaccharide/colanic/teichoic acid biosynthesis glycosyltransferase